MNTKLSICIPTYNMGRYLAPALQEFCRQILALDKPNQVEICVSDNASEDDTKRLVMEIAAEHEVQVNYKKQAINAGPDQNYMAVVELARGNYCWLFGADDLPLSGAVARVLEQINATDGSIILHERVECNFELIPTGEPTKIISTSETMIFNTANKTDFVEFVHRANNIGALFSYLSSIVFKKEIWDNNSLDERFAGTGYSHAQRLCAAIKNGVVIACTPDKNVFCRLGNDSFLEQGAADRYSKRVLLDIRGYAMIAKYVFGNDNRGDDILTILKKTHPNPFQVTVSLYESLPPALFKENATWIGAYVGGYAKLWAALAKVEGSRIKRKLLGAIRTRLSKNDTA